MLAVRPSIFYRLTDSSDLKKAVKMCGGSVGQWTTPTFGCSRRSHPPMPAWPPLIVLAGGALLAAALPTWVVSAAPPSATFFNQATAVFGWGFWVCALAWMTLDRRSAEPNGSCDPALFSLQVLLTVLLVTVGWSAWRTAFPLGLMTNAVGLLAAAGVTFWLGQVVVRNGWATHAFNALCLAMVAGATVNTGVAMVQVFAPEWTDGIWIATTSSSIAGRAAGNVRQPNHLSSLLLWGLAATAWLMVTLQGRSESNASRTAGQCILTAVGLLLCVGLVLSGSRTGTVGWLVLAAWAALDGRLPRAARGLMLILPLIYGLLWWGWTHWLRLHSATAELPGRFDLSGDISASRFSIWSNAWDLVKQQPWTGSGWGSFNFVWSLTPFPNRPTAFFDHVHNLPLHFAVELGLPLAVVICGLMGHALWRAVKAGMQAQGTHGPLASTAAVMLLIMALHSMLEYPLWYAYFLLPTGFLWGLCLALAPPSTAKLTPLGASKFGTTPATTLPRRHLVALAVGGIALMGGAGFAVWDYQRVVDIFAPSANAGPLEQRIEAGKRSVFFNHHAYYAAANDPDTPPEAVLAAVDIAGHNLLDTRLMMSWAKAFAATGDLERARHLAQRLREFGHSKEFFAVCDAPRVAEEPLPFQCTPPTRDLTYHDFLRR